MVLRQKVRAPSRSQGCLGGELPERALCVQQALRGSGGQALVPSTEPRVPLKGGPLLQICPCQDWPQGGGVPDSAPWLPPGGWASQAQPGPEQPQGPAGLRWCWNGLPVDWWGPGRAGVVPAQAGKAQEAQEAPTAGRVLHLSQQHHLLGGRLCRCHHSGLTVTLQLPQVCGDRAVHGAGGPQGPSPPSIHSHPLRPSTHRLSGTPCPGESGPHPGTDCLAGPG